MPSPHARSLHIVHTCSTQALYYVQHSHPTLVSVLFLHTIPTFPLFNSYVECALHQASMSQSPEYACAVGLAPSPTQPTQLCMRISINDIPDCDRHVHTYVHYEKRSFIQSLALMRSAIICDLICSSYHRPRPMTYVYYSPS